MDERDKIGRNLERILNERGKKPTPTSLAAGLGRTAIGDIISGKSLNPRHLTLVMIARELGVRVSEITGHQRDDVLISLDSAGIIEIPYLEEQSGGSKEPESRDYTPAARTLAFPIQLLAMSMLGDVDFLRAFVLQHDNMEPEIKKGATCIVDVDDNKPHDGSVFLIRDGTAYKVHRLGPVTGSQGKQIRLMSENASGLQEEVVDASSIEIVGKVVQSMRSHI